MHGHFLGLAGFVVHHDLFRRGHVRQVVQRLFVVLAPRVGMEGVILVVERHARADDIQHGDAVVAKRGLEEFLDLFGIAGKGARDEGCIARPAPSRQMSTGM